jgi:hypothetical protein
MEEDINFVMVKKFINKHYKLYKIRPNHRYSFSIFDKENQTDINEWEVNDYLSKIFGVDVWFIKQVFKYLIDQHIQKELAKQLKFDYE